MSNGNLTAAQSEAVKRINKSGATDTDFVEIGHTGKGVAVRHLCNAIPTVEHATEDMRKAQRAFVIAAADLEKEKLAFMAFAKRHTSAIKDHSAQLIVAMANIDRACATTLEKNANNLDRFVSALMMLNGMQIRGELDDLVSRLARMSDGPK